jgi:hypothetical protein
MLRVYRDKMELADQEIQDVSMRSLRGRSCFPRHS